MHHSSDEVNKLRPPYDVFDPSRVRLLSLEHRQDDLLPGFIQELPPVAARNPLAIHPYMQATAQAMCRARSHGASTVWMCGAHVLRAGVQPYLFALLEGGWLSGIAVNGAAVVHDFEIALRGSTTESVAHYIKDGRFGMWSETGKINEIIKAGWQRGLGIGEAMGEALQGEEYPFREQSLFARAWHCGVPVTVHVGIGYDIIHSHPNFDGAATGGASQRDFLIFAHLVDNLQGGCVCTLGSAVMAPEIFLKALSMVRNVAAQEGETVGDFTSLVCDLHDLPEQVAKEAEKTHPLYYFRPWKTLLSRTTTEGGRCYYVRARHEQSVPALWQACCEAEQGASVGKL